MALLLIVLSLTSWKETYGQTAKSTASYAYCRETCRTADGTCFPYDQALKVLQGPTKFRRPLTRQEKSSFIVYYNRLGKVDKMCICHLPHRQGQSCTQACMTGFTGWMCVSRESETCPDGQMMAEGRCAAPQCSNTCKPPNLCDTRHAIKESLVVHYGRLNPVKEAYLDDLVWFNNTKDNVLEACNCADSGWIGPDCLQRCPRGRGGQLCILDQPQCEDFCANENGECTDRLNFFYRLTKYYGRSLTKAELMHVDGLCVWYKQLPTEFLAACYCFHENAIGRNCEDGCPTGFKGKMCAERISARAGSSLSIPSRYFTVRGKVFYSIFDHLEISTKGLQSMNKRNIYSMKKEIATRLTGGMRKRGFDGALVKIPNVKVQVRDIVERRLIRQVADDAGVLVQFEVGVPPGVRSSSNISQQVAAAVRESGDLTLKGLPRLRLDQSSVTITEVTPPSTSSSPSSAGDNTSWFPVLLIASVTVCAILLAVSVIGFISWKRRHAAI